MIDTQQPQSRYTFVPAVDSDFEWLAKLRVTAMRQSLEQIGRFDAQRAIERFRLGFRADHMQLIQLPDGALVGCVSLKPCDDGYWLEHFYLLPKHQGRGLGSAVLKQLLDKTDRTGLPIRLEVLKESRAQRFYARQGFIQIGSGDWDIYMERPPSL
jgi:GNAT superfamily N-acetyltransferase